MSVATRRRTPGFGVLGNATAGLVLLALALWLLGLQARPWFEPSADASHWWLATLSVLAYVAFAAWTWRRPSEKSADAIAGPGGDTLVVYASQTGFAFDLAQRSAAILRDAGRSVRVLDIGRLDPAALAGAQSCLFVASTTGEGDAPDHALAFESQVMSKDAPAGLRHAVLALGDRSYAQYCAFGHRLDAWLQRAGSQPLFDLVEVDNADAGALRHWQHQLALFAGASVETDWAPARYDTWTLAARHHLNPGSPGGDVWLLALTPPPASTASWQAGDIAEVGPRNAREAVDALLAAVDLDGQARVREPDGQETLLRDLLARSQLPASPPPGITAQALADTLAPLPSREYSIASIPSEGRVLLLLRRMLRPDGTPGLASGWLCDHTAIGDAIDLRLRQNPGFHAPEDDRPLVLVGNGSGIAGLRALLTQRIERGQHRNWLLFGERTQAHDLHFGEELRAWHDSGQLERLDLAFSRDGGGHRYVQDALHARREELRSWLDAGASIHVCGSLRGMAPAVDAELRELVGADMLQRMAADGRYRRDVY